MSYLPSSFRLRTGFAVAATLLAAALATPAPALAAPSAAAPLPAPVVTPATVVAGTIAAVTGTLCKPASSSVDLSLTAPDGQVVARSSAEPATDGSWTAHLTPPVEATAGRYTVDATCSSQRQQLVYASRTVPVKASTAAPWTGQTPDLPNIPNGRLIGVDCPTSARCVAVGRREVGGLGLPLVETWNGSTWTVVPLASPAGSEDAVLHSVSCTARTSCVAVGGAYIDDSYQAFVASLTGTTWTTAVLPAPAGEDGAFLVDVSCATVGSCVAVGSADTEGTFGTTVPYAYLLAGTTWTASPAAAAPGTITQFTSVSCPSVSTCVAVGTATADYPYTLIAQRFDGATWTAMDPQVIPSNSASFNGVDCVSANACTAVGSLVALSSDSPPQPLVETLSGTTWSRTAVSVDPSVGGSLSSVSCGSAASCTAVGASADASSPSVPIQPVVARKVNDSWSSAPVTVPAAAAGSEFDDVVCTGARACNAVGGGGGVPLAAAGSGGGWSNLDAVAPAGYLGGAFRGVACSSPNTCTAVGWSENLVGYGTTPLVNRWNGSTWSLQPLPDVGSALLIGVACPGVGLCFAVGYVEDASFRRTPLLLQWQAGVWSRVDLHLPARAGGLTAVSCVSATSCLAVGEPASSGGAPYAVALTGTSWQLTPAPPVGTLQIPSLNGVSCLSGAGCRVVGDGRRGGNVYSGIDLVWDGSAFTAGTPVGPSGSVSCLASTSCVATSAGFTTSGAYASVLTGAQWTVEALPDPVPESSEFGAVACRASLTCVAVGDSAGTALIARRVQGTWSLEPLPATGPGGSALGGVTCPSHARCVAVGTNAQPFIIVSTT